MARLYRVRRTSSIRRREIEKAFRDDLSETLRRRFSLKRSIELDIARDTRRIAELEYSLKAHRSKLDETNINIRGLCEVLGMNADDVDVIAGVLSND